MFKSKQQDTIWMRQVRVVEFVTDFSMTLIRSHPREMPKFGTANSVWVSEQDHPVPHSADVAALPHFPPMVY